MEENRELIDPIALLIKAKDTGRGSGFLIQKNLIVTNIHVVAGATSVSAELVLCHWLSDGYNLLSLMRASCVVNRQLTVARC